MFPTSTSIKLFKLHNSPNKVGTDTTIPTFLTTEVEKVAVACPVF